MRVRAFLPLAAAFAAAAAAQTPTAATNAPPSSAVPLAWNYGPATEPPLLLDRRERNPAAEWTGLHGWVQRTADGRYVGSPQAVTAVPWNAGNSAGAPALVMPPAAAPPVAPAGKAVPATPAAGRKEPFANAKPQPGGPKWATYDITEYTSRFDTSDRPDEGVRRWLLAETGGAWNDAEMASLSVTADRVRAYHTPAVQQQVAATLGRFLYFAPGQFRCRARVTQTGNAGWRRGFESALEAVPAPEGGQAWRVPARLVEELVQDLSTGAGNSLLQDQVFLAPNGQRTLVEMDPPGGRGGGVALRFSPLIADQAVADLEYDAVARKAEAAGQANAPEEWRAGSKGHARVAAGQALLVSLGRGPGLDQRVRLLNPRPETLLILELAPEAGSTLAGQPLPPPPASLADRRTGAADPQRRSALSPRRREDEKHTRLFGSLWH